MLDLRMTIIFTDLDGTLLDKESYSWEAARPALERIAKLSVPLIIVTSKTRREVEQWRRALHNTDPYVVENGGAAVIPGSEPMVWGTSYSRLCEALREAARRSGCRVRGFHQMDVREIAAVTGLSAEEAALAAGREYDEPFLIESGSRAALLDAIAQAGLRHTEGGRFHHIHGNNDKAVAVRALLDHYRGLHGEVTSAGLGDAPNDIEFLKVVDRPHFSQEGPAGWNRFVLDLLS